MNEKISIDDLTVSSGTVTLALEGLEQFMYDHCSESNNLTRKNLDILNSLTHAVISLAKNHERQVKEYNRQIVSKSDGEAIE